MPCSGVDQPRRQQNRLDSSLLKLRRRLRFQSATPEPAEAVYTVWQSRWASRRTEIVRRLEAIDSQLDRLARPHILSPRLALTPTEERVNLPITLD